MQLSDRNFFATASLTDITLRVRDLRRMLGFYRERIGLREIGRDGPKVGLSATGSAPALIVLVEDSSAPARSPSTTGLFHLALLLPDRAALAALVRRLTHQGVRFDGAADHGVSEAFYLSDPEGNGVELYADKPAASWPLAGDDVAMVTEPLDYDSLLALGGPEAPGAPLPHSTRMGHVHLSVSDLVSVEKLFVGSLGLSVRQRNYPGALFFAYDGYHHHLAANTWRGTRRPLAGSLGLISLTLCYPGGLAQPGTPSPFTAAGFTVCLDAAKAILSPVEQSPLAENRKS